MPITNNAAILICLLVTCVFLIAFSSMCVHESNSKNDTKTNTPLIVFSIITAVLCSTLLLYTPYLLKNMLEKSDSKYPLAKTYISIIPAISGLILSNYALIAGIEIQQSETINIPLRVMGSVSLTSTLIVFLCTFFFIIKDETDLMK